ncbi:MAG: prepilin-type N-terminal cleavage/methylation domain-containing protein [Rhodospirillaceae bacterium]|jgi:prepilin-type N-terminal cleavage/methylation domain-containing protein|nr:prepilin-type N-terminal cleavage/methylation domain-containing protein [Rhodospirillaceae bacterium]
MSSLSLPRAKKGSQGFTFIEAIVAMAIVGMAALPILLLISQSLDQLTRSADANERASAMQSAIAIIDPINPMNTPSGETSMGTISFTWTSELLVAPNDGEQVGAGLPGYRVGFYKVTIDVTKMGSPWFNFDMRKVGYEKIQYGLPFERSGL